MASSSNDTVSEAVPPRLIVGDSITTSTGCLALGCLKVVATMWTLWGSANLLYIAYENMEETSSCTTTEAVKAIVGRKPPGFVTHCTVQAINYALAKLGGLFLLWLGSVYGLQAGFLIYGTIQKRREFIQPFVNVEIGNAIAMCLLTLSAPDTLAPLFASGIGLGIYGIFVVRWHLEYLREVEEKKQS